MVYVTWIAPWLTAMNNQWHYGDARISHTTMQINGKQRDLLGNGYHGQVEILLLPDPTDPASRVTAYIMPHLFRDTANRLVILHPEYVNSDHSEDIVVEIEGTNGVLSVLYGRADGTFQWNTPPQ